MPELREVFEMTTKQIEPDMDSWRDQEKRQRKANRNKKVAAFAAMAAITLVAVAVVLGTRGGQNVTTPADEPAVSPVATAREVATGFVEAFGSFDADRAITYLADDADLSGLEGGTQNLPSLLSLLEAQGYEQMLTSCDGSGGTAGTDVVCTFDFHGLRSDEIGLGPYSGSYFALTVRDGKIVRASLYWETGEFSPQMWEPFATWVSKNYPEDAAAMYNGDQTNWLLTEESIRLWGQHTREYVGPG